MEVKILTCGCHKVDTSGNVSSCLEQFSKKGIRGIQTQKTDFWKFLHPVKSRAGYLQVNIHGRIIRVNRLVAFNFLSNPSALPEVQHINDIKADNRVENLKWGTQKDNASDRNLHGHTCRGTKNKNAKLNENKVRQIRKLRQEGLSLNKIAKKFNVSKKLILLINQNKIWVHVK